jgi:hypothetical protein
VAQRDTSEESVQILKEQEVEQVSGGAVTVSGVLAFGAGIAGVGAVALMGSPILAAGALAYGAVAAGLGLSAAMVALFE